MRTWNDQHTEVVLLGSMTGTSVTSWLLPNLPKGNLAEVILAALEHALSEGVEGIDGGYATSRRVCIAIVLVIISIHGAATCAAEACSRLKY